MYLLAGIFKETGMAFIVYVCINLFFGINTIITHSVVFLLSQEKATDQVGRCRADGDVLQKVSGGSHLGSWEIHSGQGVGIECYRSFIQDK